MSWTQADQRLAEARTAIGKAITALADIETGRAPGLHDFMVPFQRTIQRSLVKLIKLRNKLGGTAQEDC